MAAPDEDVWHARWEQALHEMELDVESAERLLEAAHLPDVADVARAAAWRPPSGLGALPLPLRDRAQALLDRQLDAAARIAQAVVVSRRHLHATRTIEARTPAVPVYLDTQG
ncbi:hypothetical protein [Cellulomonas sp. SLBN-39]|uniref:hypothetical protein n=1 Tax=Cellulomonas sp. SLBN-39 TaxID=2768446 RepID=UPI00117466A1|nr:hypothetical protein [Cellulomonas sp. SLBN-39]TQL01642.1 hypothetical protein FBY24_0697 [Cellulomonas sp. SLBN-39]